MVATPPPPGPPEPRAVWQVPALSNPRARARCQGGQCGPAALGHGPPRSGGPGLPARDPPWLPCPCRGGAEPPPPEPGCTRAGAPRTGPPLGPPTALGEPVSEGQTPACPSAAPAARPDGGPHISPPSSARPLPSPPPTGGLLLTHRPKPPGPPSAQPTWPHSPPVGCLPRPTTPTASGHPPPGPWGPSPPPMTRHLLPYGTPLSTLLAPLQAQPSL